MSKSAVMVFSVEDGWKRGKHKLPKVTSYSYLGIDFGAWDVHLKIIMEEKSKPIA